jgi:hypothetical protein
VCAVRLGSQFTRGLYVDGVSAKSSALATIFTLEEFLALKDVNPITASCGPTLRLTPSAARSVGKYVLLL